MKFINNIYDEETKCSITTVQHFGRYFEGKAKVSPEEENVSELFGGRLSESRAVLHALQYEKQIRFEEYHTISNFVKSCCNTKRFDKDSSSAKTVFHQLNLAEKKYEKVKENIKLLKKAIKEMMDDRDRFFEKRSKKDKE